MTIGKILGACLAGLLLTATHGQAADQYPNKPINITVPFAAGADTDASARFLGKQASEIMGQAWIAVNRVGGSGSIGSTYVAQAAPDGYNLLLGTTSTHSINPFVFKKLQYSLDQFTPVGLVTASSFLLAVSPTLPVKNLKELSVYLKAHPGELNFGTAGINTTSDLGRMMVEQGLGGKFTAIPYNGTTEVLAAIMGGAVQAGLLSATTAIENEKAGKIRVLAALSNKRVKTMPHVPTSVEEGYPSIIAESWYAVFAPAKTPTDIVQQLNTVMRKATDSEMLRKFATDIGGDPDLAPTMDVAATKVFLDDQASRWEKLVKALNIQAD